VGKHVKQPAHGPAQRSSFDAATGSDYNGPVEVTAFELNGRTIRLARPAEPDRLLDDPGVLEWNQRDGYMPYWAFLWPAAFLLADLVSRKEDWHLPVAHRAAPEALEIGCGLGLAGLVAVTRGLRVLFTDYDSAALEFVSRSAAENGFHAGQFAVRRLDWRVLPDERFGLIIGADVIYEAPLVPLVARLLAALLAPRGVGLIASPDRAVAQRFPAEIASLGLCCQAEPATSRTESGCSITGTIYRVTAPGI
jgi:predicted nicotinamide N-methyase